MTEGAPEGDSVVGVSGGRSVQLPALLAEGRGLADALAQEVEGGATRVAVTRDLDLLHPRRVHEEGALDADAGRDATYRDLLIEPAVAHPEHRALELLEPLAVAL